MSKSYTTAELTRILTLYAELCDMELASADEMLAQVQSLNEGRERHRDITWLSWFITEWDITQSREQIEQGKYEDLIERLADAFSAEVQEAFSTTEIESMRVHTRTKGRRGRSLFDMCDANQLMCNAAEANNIELFVTPTGQMSDETIDLVNKAWTFAESVGYRC